MEEDRSFLRGHFAEIPGGSVLGHTTPAITRAAERLAKKYAGVPSIESIAPKLGEPTQNKGGRKKKKK